MLKNSHLPRVFMICFILITIFITNHFSFAQAKSKINWTRMQRDLEIMEGVLNKLISPPKNMFGPWNIKTRALYFDDYGVVFQVDYGGYQIYAVKAYKMATDIRNAEQLLEVHTHLKGDAPVLMETESESEEDQEEPTIAARIKHLKKQILEFLGNYADAIGQLKDSDCITVLVNLGNDHWYYPLMDRHQMTNKEQVSILEATAKKSDLSAYRRGDISENEFSQRVVFNQRPQNEAMTKNLDIMANIIDTALSKKYYKEFGSEGKTRGIYLEGLGVLFFMKANLSHKAFVPEIQVYFEEYLKTPDVKTIRKGREKKSQMKIRELLDEFESALLEVVGDYSHTLSTLKPTDYVVVSVDPNDGWGYRESIPSRFIMKVQKKELDNFNRGSMKLTELRKRVNFLEY